MLEYGEQLYELTVGIRGLDIGRDKFLKSYSLNLKDPSNFYYVYVDAGRLLGFFVLHLKCSLSNPNDLVGKLQVLIVGKSIRGQGLGSLLFDTANRLSIEKGCSYLEVVCFEEKELSHFYESKGVVNNRRYF